MKKCVLLVVMALLSGLAEAQGGLYSRYSSRADVGVAYVAGYELDSAVVVDATIFLAHNEAEWQWIAREFAIDPGMDTAAKLFRLAPRGRPDLKFRGGSPVGNDCVVASRRLWTVSVFHISNMEQYRAILRRELRLE